MAKVTHGLQFNDKSVSFIKKKKKTNNYFATCMSYTICFFNELIIYVVHVGGWATAPGGPYSWGYCFVREVSGGLYCEWNPNYPCASGQEYYGRGPIQLSWLVHHLIIQSLMI